MVGAVAGKRVRSAARARSRTGCLLLFPDGRSGRRPGAHPGAPRLRPGSFGVSQCHAGVGDANRGEARGGETGQLWPRSRLASHTPEPVKSFPIPLPQSDPKGIKTNQSNKRTPIHKTQNTSKPQVIERKIKKEEGKRRLPSSARLRLPPSRLTRQAELLVGNQRQKPDCGNFCFWVPGIKCGAAVSGRKWLSGKESLCLGQGAWRSY